MAVKGLGNIKGTLACYSFDNLGASIALGFVESFNSYYCCRICEMEKTESRKACKEDLSLYRTKESYSQHLEIISKSEKVDYKQTKGIKRYCVLNNLKYFHMFDNPYIDPMHDLNEGIIRDLLKYLFDYCIQEKIITEASLKGKIQCFNYGRLNTRNKPSVLLRDKANLNQSASQIFCLLIHTPFILFDHQYNSKLQQVWICVESLIRITQIVYSNVLTERDLTELEETVSMYLRSVQEKFEHKLKPKDHYLTHYASVIRAMGPVKKLSMMRFEAKHRQLKNLIQSSRNFKNIPKSIVQKHQKHMVHSFNMTSKISYSKKKSVLANTDFTHDFISTAMCVHEIKWFEVNSYRYQKGLIITLNERLYEIEQCIMADKQLYLLCNTFLFTSFHKFSNSFEVERAKPTINEIIRYADIENRTLYELKYVGDKTYIIADDLSLHFLINK